ncbi:MAG: DUF86 domain-containing protein [Hyphomicrobiaceae bacterium]|nr:DUF86 domain-containing protein [Hyphomicrobiaceae bacterium]
MIRSTRPRLHDILENIQIIRTAVHGRTIAHFDHDMALRYTVLHALMIIAEAVRHLPPSLTADHPDVPWKHIVGLGVHVKHEYHRVDTAIVWSAVNRGLDQLEKAAKGIMTHAD